MSAAPPQTAAGTPRRHESRATRICASLRSERLSLPMLNAAPVLRHRCCLIGARLLLVLLTCAATCDVGRGGEWPYANPLLASPAVQTVADSADGDSYWIVSTRRAAQHRLDPPSSTFDFLRRQEDGSIVNSSGAAMQA